MDKGTILGLIGIIIGSIITSLAPKLRELVKKTDTNIDDIALEIVIQVNEIFSNSSNESKKQRAKDMIELATAKEGIKNISDKILDKTVEMAVTKAKLLEAEKQQTDTSYLDNIGVKTPVAEKKVANTNSSIEDSKILKELVTDIKRDYGKSLVYTDVAFKTNPFKIKDSTTVIGRVGFTKYF